MPRNHLFLESALTDRLREQVPALTLVGGANDAVRARASESAQSPAAYVVYDGENVADSSHDGSRQAVVQRWQIWLYVRHAGQDGGAGLRRVAGEALAELIAALAGFVPPGEVRPITRVNAPRPMYSASSGWYPLAYEARIVTPKE